MASEQNNHNWLVNFGLEYHSYSVVEHWLLKPSILGLSSVSWWLFFSDNDNIRISSLWHFPSLSMPMAVIWHSRHFQARFRPRPFQSERSGIKLHTIPLSQNSCQWLGVGQPCSHTDRKTAQSPQVNVSACHSSNRPICPALNSAI